MRCSLILLVPQTICAFISPKFRRVVPQIVSRRSLGCETTNRPLSAMQATIEPTDLFSTWAKTGRDEIMAAGHLEAVTEMLEELDPYLLKYGRFSFLDVGCGNGWLARHMITEKKALCERSVGVDGAKEMIKKAERIEGQEETKTGATFTCQNILDFKFDEPFDVVFSMEVLYYLEEKEVKIFLKNLSERIIRRGGYFVLGLDHFKENDTCHDWAEINNTRMLLWKEQQWKEALESAGFDLVKGPWRAAKGRDQMPSGTLAFIAKNI